MKRTMLQRRTPLRSRRRRVRVESGRAEWKTPRSGCCENCGSFASFLHGHHVIFLQHVRVEHGQPWDPDNRMDLCPGCHAGFHAGSVRIPISRLPARSLVFAVALLGGERAHDYLGRRYSA